jgi:hypothetical protein
VNTIDNVQLLFRCPSLRYRYNGFLDSSDVFVGEFVFPLLKQGINLTLALAPGTYCSVKDAFCNFGQSNSEWIYQLILKGDGEKTQLTVSQGDESSRAIKDLERVTLPLHQLALLQMSTMQT